MDREICLAVVQQHCGLALDYFCEELKKDREICLAAVQQDGGALSYVCEELKKEREICLAAVQQDGQALQHVCEEFKKDREICLVFLHDASKFGLCWDEGMKELVWNAGQEIFQQDTESGLYPCILVASSNRSDVGTVYEMLKHCPEILPYQQVLLKKRKRLSFL